MRCYGFQNEVKSYLNRLERENGFRISATSAKALNDRVEGLKKSRIWSQYSLGFNDTDGDSYLSRAGVTDLIGRSEVLWFVRGMKALGLYSNMVAWPLRSYQNAGTGSTVYSLGGLGRFNGTMVNSPTWGIEGVNFLNSSSQNISLPSVLNGGDSYLNFSCARLINISMPHATISSLGNSRGGVIAAASNGDYRTRSVTWSFTGSSTGAKFSTQTNTLSNFTSTIVGDSSGARYFENVYQYNAEVGDYRLSSLSGNLPRIAGHYISAITPANNPWNGVISTTMFLNVSINNQIHSLLYVLYKQTLGNGLGLP